MILLTGLVLAADFWEKKPYSKWSKKDVEKMFNDSPWGKTHNIAILPNESATGNISVTTPGDLNTTTARNQRTLGSRNLEREQINYFHIRFLSAKPMRMAVARTIMLNNKGKVNQASLDAFVEKGDPDNIMIVMQVSAKPASSPSLPEYRSALMNLRTPDLVNNASLATKSGKKVFLAHYEPPGRDGLGAKLFFPRNMPDGTPFATLEDEEIRFEMEIKTRTIQFGRGEEGNVPSNEERVDRIYRQFKLKDMMLKGKLEI
jgi:hypothetical protein